MALTDNLVSYWSLEETIGNSFDAHGSNTLADVNTVGTATGKIGNSRLFVRANSESLFISDAGQSGLDFSGNSDFTLAGWFYIESVTAADQYLIGKGNLTGPNFQYGIFYDASESEIAFFVSPDGSATPANNWDAATISTGTWYFVVAYHDGAGDVIGISLNGATPEETAHATGVFNGNGNFTLGQLQNFGGFLDGRLDEVAVWGRVLSDTEISWLYNSGTGRSYSHVSDAVDQPTGLTATANGTTAIDLAWTDNATAEDNYEIDRSLNGTDWTLIDTIAAGSTSYAATGLTAGTLYYFRVRAVNAIENGAYSSTASATTDVGTTGFFTGVDTLFFD